jgi:LacI family transcriptional regulator
MNLKELSKKLGLSQTTVSRALNGYPEVSEATRLRVKAVAEQFNYTPSARAKGLATGKALAIGHVIPKGSNNEMMNPIFGDFIAGAGESCARNGYEMIISVVDSSTDEATVYQGLKSRNAVDGVIIHGPRRRDPRILLLQDIGLPFVVHGRSSEIDEPYSWLDVNNKRAFERATKFLIDLGHKRVALINGNEEMDFARRRRAGFEDAFKDKGLVSDTDLMVSSEMTEDLGYAAASEMLTRDTPPTAFVVASMISAIGVRRAIEERGLTMGRDVSVVSHDDNLSYLQNGADVPIFTATRSSVREAGGEVAEMLIERIADPGKPAKSKLYEAELIMGQSTGPAPT